MALIVRLSKEQPVHRALAAISTHPRRILQRYRDNMPIRRIQELDPACIRDYARRPGITAAEKAGSRQCLLAVRRREHRDTLENRVTCWVMDRLGCVPPLTARKTAPSRTMRRSRGSVVLGRTRSTGAGQKVFMMLQGSDRSSASRTTLSNLKPGIKWSGKPIYACSRRSVK